MNNNTEFINNFTVEQRKKKSVFKKIFDEIQSNDSDTDNSDSSGMIWKNIISPKKDLNLSVICLDDEQFANDNQNQFKENVNKFIKILESNVVETKTNDKHFINEKIVNKSDILSNQRTKFEKINNKRKIPEEELEENKDVDADKFSLKKLHVLQETTNKIFYLRNRNTNPVTVKTIIVLRIKGG